jgi:flavin-dependent dehydrogenase
VCVIGGGPAGSSVAHRLAVLGHRVCIVERGDTTRATVVECMPSSIVPALELLGVLPEIISSSGTLCCERTRMRWSGEGEILRRRDASVLMERGTFDRILLDSAVRAGASLLRPARARTPIRTSSGWSVPIDTGTGPIAMDAALVVDATGKRPSVAKLGTPTVALCGRWRGIRLSGAPEMRIEAGPLAWYWGAPFSDASFAALVFVDPGTCAGLNRNTRETAYRTLLASSKLLSDCLVGTLIGEVRVRDASCRIDLEPISGNLIKVGDRSVAMDPISSQGVQAAIRSGVQASVVINTILKGGDRDAAVDFYRSTQRETADRHRRAATSLYASQSFYDSAFWRERAGSDTMVHSSARTQAVPLSPETRLRCSSDTHIVEMPVIDGDVIRRRPVLAHPSLDYPIAWLGGVELSKALGTIGSGRPVSAILSDLSDQIAPASAANLLAWLTEHGILVQVKALEEGAAPRSLRGCQILP